MVQPTNDESSSLILAAEDCDPQEFSRLHRFSVNDNRVIQKLVAHGPVLLQGGRGSGKSALMIEASKRLAPQNPASSAFGVYISLRHLPLLRTSGRDYEEIFCSLVSRRIQESLSDRNLPFDLSSDVASLQYGVAQLSQVLQQRIVLLFDDAAHIGREASLGDFFDLFRTLSSSTISCKAAIYPGVTNFGTRFDVYNDATVVEVIRDEDQPEFIGLFAEVMQARFPALFQREVTSPLNINRIAGFLGQSVLGNMRGFVFACNELENLTSSRSIGLNTANEAVLLLARNYYWPLLDEVSPKLGKYVPMVGPARQITEAILQECGTKANGRRSALVHRDILSRFQKPFEILEYVGFLSKRESSRALKSGGRGARFEINLCILLEQVPGARLTSELFDRWTQSKEEAVEFHSRGAQFADVTPALPNAESELEILDEPVERLRKSRAYPYGLTDNMIDTLQNGGYITVRGVSDATDEQLDGLRWFGEATVKRIRNVIGQAVWM